jgi:hypothetical protein
VVLLVPQTVAIMPSCDTLTDYYTIACSGGGFPSSYNGTVFIAEHGSWARDPAIGYRLAAVKLAPNGTAVRHTIFASGWLLRNGTVWGAPFLPYIIAVLLCTHENSNILGFMPVGRHLPPAMERSGIASLVVVTVVEQQHLFETRRISSGLFSPVVLLDQDDLQGDIVRLHCRYKGSALP